MPTESFGRTTEAEKAFRDKVEEEEEKEEEEARVADYGVIYSEDSCIDADLNGKLNLNCFEQFLPQNRKTVLQRVITELSRVQRKGNWKRTDVMRMLRLFSMPDESGKKKEYAGIVIWYLMRKLGSLSD